MGLLQFFWWVKPAWGSLTVSAKQYHWPEGGRWMYLSWEGTGSQSWVCSTFCGLWAWSRRHSLIKGKNSTDVTPGTPGTPGCPSAPAVAAAPLASQGSAAGRAQGTTTFGRMMFWTAPCFAMPAPSPPLPKTALPVREVQNNPTSHPLPQNTTQHSTRADSVNGKGGWTLSGGERSFLPLMLYISPDML